MMELALQGSRALPQRTHVLADLAAAREIGCRYCLDIGSWIGLQNALEPEDLSAIDEFESSPRFSEAERAAIGFAVAMSRTPVEVDDALFERLRRSYDDEQIVELAAIVGWEQFRARINHAMGLTPDGFLIVETGDLIPYGDDRLRFTPVEHEDGRGYHWCRSLVDAQTFCLFVPGGAS